MFDEYDESVYKDDEKEETLVQQKRNRQHHKRNQPMYDSYQEDLWKEDEEVGKMIGFIIDKVDFRSPNG